MEMMEGIKTRRSIRSFKAETVSRAEIEKVIAASAYAPSWKNTQTARYIVIDNKAIIKRIAEEGISGFAPNQKVLEGCGTVVVLASVAKRSGYERDGSYTTSKEDKWEMFDAGIAAQTFMLAAHDMGIGTVLMGIFDEEKIREIIDLPEDRNVSALIAMGYPQEEPEAPRRKTVDELVEYRA